MLKHSKV